MFDISTIARRFFEVRIGDTVLEIEPPKLKTLKKISALAKANDENAMDDLTAAVALILSKNRQGKKIDAAYIEDVIEMDLDQMRDFLTAYFRWLSEARNDPN